MSDAHAERTRQLVDPGRLGAWLDGQGLPGGGEPGLSLQMSLHSSARQTYFWTFRKRVQH